MSTTTRLIIISCIVLAACIAASILLVKLFGRRHRFRRGVKILTGAGIAAGLFLAAAFIYLQIYTPADAYALSFLQSSGAVTVTKTDNGYFFDGAGEDKALVFYPGAKIEAAAYAPLMTSLAEEGLDCFLVEMPFHFALFDMDAASGVMQSYAYPEWYIGGHSLGGVAASSYAADHADALEGVILLASYPNRKLDDHLALCSVYGSEDGCLDMGKYAEAEKNWPADASETVIDGGNHAQFGSYGAQEGDGAARISAEEQVKQTAEAVMACMGAD